MRHFGPAALLSAALALVPATGTAQSVDGQAAGDMERPRTVGVALVVNDSIMTHTEVEQRLRLAAILQDLPVSSDTLDAALEQTVPAMIDELLKAGAIAADGIRVSAQEVRSTRRAFAGQRFADGEQGLLRALRTYDVDAALLDRQIEVELAWRRYVEQRVPRHRVITAAEVSAWLEAHAPAEETAGRVRIAMIQTASATEAGLIISRLAAGEAFADLARTHSQAASARNSGEIGWLEMADLAPEVAQALAALEPGEHTPPLAPDGAAGVFVFKLLERETPRQDPAARRLDARRRLLEERVDRAARELLLNLRRSAYIDIRF